MAGEDKGKKIIGERQRKITDKGRWPSLKQAELRVKASIKITTEPQTPPPWGMRGIVIGESKFK